MAASLIAEKCGWNLERISRAVELVLDALIRGSVPKADVENLALVELFQCSDNSCVPALDKDSVREIILTYKDTLGSYIEKLVGKNDMNTLLGLLQMLYDLSIEGVSKIVDDKVPRAYSGDKLLFAQINEILASMLYADLEYDRAAERFDIAANYYREAGQEDRALFMEAFRNIVKAEKLKEEASRLHEDNKHSEEEELIKQASRLYAESSTLFRKCSATISEALVNAILSKCDAYEVLANYYFTHGQVDEAEKYYNLCMSELRLEYVGLSEEHRKLIELKERTCRAFARLCRAIIEQKMELYEEAGDEFRELVKEGYVEDVMVELAAIAYKGAIDTAENLDDILRVYPKYIELVSLYTDRRIREKYGDFLNFLKELRVRPLASISKDIRIDEYALKMYIAYKILIDVARQLNVNTSIVPEVLTLVAGLGLDPLTVSGAELRMEVARTSLEIDTAKLDLICKLLDEYHKKVMELLFS